MKLMNVSPEVLMLKSGRIDNNTYIIHNKYDAIVVDPSFAYDDIVSVLKEYKLDLKAILLTHGHADHTFCAGELAKKYNVKMYISADDMQTVTKYSFMQMFKMNDSLDLSSIIEIKQSNVTIGDFSLKMIKCPGHTSGGASFVYKNCVFTGDTLFADSVGRTDLINSNPLKLVESIKKIFELDDKMIVLPGHGQISNLKDIKINNLVAISCIK